jgi:aminoglycoside 6'-N-acetyltransferase
VPDNDIGVRLMSLADLPCLAGWLSAPHVIRWWGQPPGHDALVAKYTARIEGRDPTTMYVVTVGQRPVGMAQCYRVRDYPDWATSLAATGRPGSRGGSRNRLPDRRRVRDATRHWG